MMKDKSRKQKKTIYEMQRHGEAGSLILGRNYETDGQIRLKTKEICQYIDFVCRGIAIYESLNILFGLIELQ